MTRRSRRTPFLAVADVGERIKAERIRRGLTGAALSRAAGLSAGMLSRVERGRRTPSRRSLRALAHALDVNPASLLADGMDAVAVHVRAEATRFEDASCCSLARLGGRLGTIEIRRVRLRKHDFAPLFSEREGWMLLYVLTGELRFLCAERLYLVAQGGSLSFDARRTHGPLELLSPIVEYLSVAVDEPHPSRRHGPHAVPSEPLATAP